MTGVYCLQVAAGDACPSGQLRESGHCCSLCPAGFGVVAKCGKEDTKCAPCPRGKKLYLQAVHEHSVCFTGFFIISAIYPRCWKINRNTICLLRPLFAQELKFTICFPGTFSASEGLGPCKPCATCPLSVPKLASCTATEDTQCECDSGFFFWGVHGLCAPCSSCGPGQGLIQECSPKGDTVCRVCGPGRFSEELRSTKPCQVCTKCSDSEVEIRACMPNSDTLCMGE